MENEAIDIVVTIILEFWNREIYFTPKINYSSEIV